MALPFIKTIADWTSGRDDLIAARYGVIHSIGGALQSVELRPWPKLASWPELWPVGPRYHARGEADECRLYYNQPRWFPNFLALKYVASTAGTSYATCRAALVALDELAELKGVDALLCDAANTRISDRLLARFGWAPHKPQRWRRNFIKRFYGAYPTAST
jgi:hypothetical protein